MKKRERIVWLYYTRLIIGIKSLMMIQLNAMVFITIINSVNGLGSLCFIVNKNNNHYVISSQNSLLQA